MSTVEKVWQPIQEILARHADEDDAEWDEVFGSEPLVTVWPPLATFRRLREN